MKVLIKVGGELVGVLCNNPSKSQVKEFKEAMKELYPGERVTVKEAEENDQR